MPTESAPLEGLKANGVFEDLGIVPLDGFTADAVVTRAKATMARCGGAR